MTVRIITAHVLDGLAQLPDESVHCVVTSPPYFGLRLYGTEPQVWHVLNGNPELAYPKCENGHEWVDIGKSGQRLRNGIGSNTAKVAFGEILHPPIGALCSQCNAWRGDLGLEPTLNLYLDHMVDICREIRRVLRKDGTFWLNIGDSYGGSWGAQSPLPTGPLRDAGLKPKDLMLIPFRLAIRLQEDGWWVRSAIVWAKRAPMPESVEDRPTSSWEPVFLLTKSELYFYDGNAVKEESATPTGSTRSMRNVWHLGPSPFPEAHFATFPSEVPRRAILAGTSDRGVCSKCGAPWKRIVIKSRTRDGEPLIGGWPMNEGGQRLPASGIRHGRVERKSETTGWRPTCTCEAGEPVPATVLDPFVGSGTTAIVAAGLLRDCIGIELNPKYTKMILRRVAKNIGVYRQEGNDDAADVVQSVSLFDYVRSNDFVGSTPPISTTSSDPEPPPELVRSSPDA